MYEIFVAGHSETNNQSINHYYTEAKLTYLVNNHIRQKKRQRSNAILLA